MTDFSCATRDAACIQMRLTALSALCPETTAALDRAAMSARSIPVQRELVREGQDVPVPLAILSGWAARVRLLDDGRRQIMTLLLPGDIVYPSQQVRPRALATVIGLTRLTYCRVPYPDDYTDLAAALAAGAALQETYLLAQIVRIGRLNAEERLIDLFLELHGRLAICDLVEQAKDGAETMPFPLTQEALGDATGLTQVHVNRTLQQLRRQGDVELSAGRLTLLDPEMLRQRVSYGSL